MIYRCSFSNSLLALNMDIQESRIAVLDDDRDVLLSLDLLLKKKFSQVDLFSKPSNFLEQQSINPYDLIIMDMNYSPGRTDGKEGIQLLKKLQAIREESSILLLTAYSNINIAIEAIKIGANDFLVKPWQNEKLLLNIETLLAQKDLEKELSIQQRILALNKNEIEPLIGESDFMINLRAKISESASRENNLLLFGESGVGKTLAAMHIHYNSAKQNKPFINANLELIPKSLINEHLFGNSESNGKLKLAEGACLLIKGAEKISDETWGKLLEYSKKESKNFTRIIFSTRKWKSLKSRNFQSIESISIEPLRNRKEDIPDLIEYYLEKFAKYYDKKPVFKEVHELLNYAWPGNISELKNATERAVMLNNHLNYLDFIPAKSNPLNLAMVEKSHLLKVLKHYDFNISKSAKDLGLSRAALYRKMAKYNIG